MSLPLQSLKLGLMNRRRPKCRVPCRCPHSESIQSRCTAATITAIRHQKNLDKTGSSYLWVGVIFIFPNCYATGLLALLNARTSLDELNTDNLSLPTASLVWMRTSRSTGIPATRGAVTGGTQGDVVHDNHGVVSYLKCNVYAARPDPTIV
ncbi:hypothetical protein BD779DRAFT_262606 [Infundibulicybe gibba]|nr:hypothetical protein BD779DRAFT_294786 [Infundibulicybe gibba]KAF8874122.1 hypothetical protein BD779DRAFT_262606 [Infundibulicybe gibba]